jgi:hypothetical protein
LKEGCSEAKIALPGLRNSEAARLKRCFGPLRKVQRGCARLCQSALMQRRSLTRLWDELESLQCLRPDLLVSNVAQCRAGKQHDSLTSFDMRKRYPREREGDPPCQFGRISHSRIWLPIWFACHGLQLCLMNGMRAVRDSSLEAWKAAAALLYQSPSQMKGEKTDIERQAVNRSAKPLSYFGSHAVTHPIT